MYLTSKKKQELFKKFSFAKSETDTGSPEAQVALFSHRIEYLTEHLKKNKKDNSTRLGLLKLVGKRKKFLNYLQKKDIERYKAIIGELKIRK